MRGICFAIVVAMALTSCSGQAAYHAAAGDERASVVIAVRDYYALRNSLTAGFAITDFWRTYPELNYDHDVARGINLEVMLWSWSQDPRLARLDYQTELESYEPLRVFVRAGEG